MKGINGDNESIYVMGKNIKKKIVKHPFVGFKDADH